MQAEGMYAGRRYVCRQKVCMQAEGMYAGN